MRRLLLPLSCAFLVALLGGCERDPSRLPSPAESFEQGQAYLRDHDYAGAVRSFNDAEQLAARQGRRDMELQAVGQSAKVARELGQFETLVAKAAQGAQLARQLGDFRAEAALRILEGRAYADLGLRSLSSRVISDAGRIASTFNDNAAVADAENALGELWLDANEVQVASDHFQRAAAAADSVSSTTARAIALRGMAESYRRQGKLAESQNLVARARDEIDRSDNPEDAARLRLEEGIIQESAGSRNAALAAYREGVNLLRRARIGRRLEVQLLFRIGRLYEAGQRRADGRKYFADAMDIARREGDRAAQYYINLYILRSDAGALPPAQHMASRPRLVQAYGQLAQQFSDILQRPGEAMACGFVGRELEAAGDLAGARRWLARAAAADRSRFLSYVDPEFHRPLIEALGADVPGVWAADLAGLYLADRRIIEALTVLEQQRQASFADDLVGLDLTFRHPRLSTEATSVREAMFRLQLAGAQLSVRLAGMPPGQERDPGLAPFRDRLTALRRRAAALEAAYPNYGSVAHADTLDLTSIQRFIPRGTTVIEHVPVGNGIAIVALSRERQSVQFVATTSATIRELRDEYLRLIQDPLVYTGEAGEASVPAMTRFASVSTQLYDLLLRPVEAEFDRGLIVVASDLVEGLPLHALEKQDRSGRVEHLVEYLSVDYLTSWRALQFPTRPATRWREIVAWGNPSGKNWSVDYELRDVRSFFRNAQVLIGRDASWEGLSELHPDLLQIASEFRRGLSRFGLFTVSTGEPTEETDDIPFEQLLRIEPPPVVLLSNAAGERMTLGVEQAALLRLNGTSDVFLNGWGGDRRGAKLFSEFFFTHLANGLAPGDAYRQALLNLIQTKEVSHPRSWAQFFHYGAG